MWNTVNVVHMGVYIKWINAKKAFSRSCRKVPALESIYPNLGKKKENLHFIKMQIDFGQL